MCTDINIHIYGKIVTQSFVTMQRVLVKQWKQIVLYIFKSYAKHLNNYFCKSESD